MSRFAGRALDRVWFTFLVLHIPISLTLDLQLLYPPQLIPRPLVAFIDWYTGWSKDPIVLGAHTKTAEWGWLYVFFWVEAVVQIPLCAVGAYGLWRSEPSSPILPPRIWRVHGDLRPPVHLTASLLGSYGPFMMIPLGMAVDMTARLVHIVSAAQERKSL
ncbi:hypothetical protein Q5752_004056 [Cryptotrichosporon argae]